MAKDVVFIDIKCQVCDAHLQGYANTLGVAVDTLDAMKEELTMHFVNHKLPDEKG